MAELRDVHNSDGAGAGAGAGTARCDRGLYLLAIGVVTAVILGIEKADKAEHQRVCKPPGRRMARPVEQHDADEKHKAAETAAAPAPHPLQKFLPGSTAVPY